jgi:hypothetical protein
MPSEATAAALVLVCGLALAAPARSQTESEPRLMRAQGVFFEHEAARGIISLKERGQVRIYALLPGDESGETEVVIESAPARVSDLVSGAPVIVFWRPDDEDRTRRVAHKVEVPRIPKSYRDDFR